MTRAYALKQLLRLGPLTYREILEITGWKVPRLRNALADLDEAGALRRVNVPGVHRCVYSVLGAR